MATHTSAVRDWDVRNVKSRRQERHCVPQYWTGGKEKITIVIENARCVPEFCRERSYYLSE